MVQTGGGGGGLEMAPRVFSKLEPPQYYAACHQGALVNSSVFGVAGLGGHLSNGGGGEDGPNSPFAKRVKRSTMSSMSSNEEDFECLDDGPSSSGYFVTSQQSPLTMVGGSADQWQVTAGKLTRRDCEY